MEARRSRSAKRDVEPPSDQATTQHSPAVPAPQAAGSIQPAPRDVQISGPNSPTFYGPANDINFNYHFHLPGRTARWEPLREFGQKGKRPEEFRGAYGVAGLDPDEIAVADWGNKRVAIFSTDGCLKSTILQTSDPWDVAATRRPTYDRLVVVCQTSSIVKVFNIQDSTLAFDFPTVPRNIMGKAKVSPRSVAVKTDETIVVGDVKRKKLTMHSPTDGSLIRTIRVTRAPMYMAVDNDRVVISDGKQEVDVTDGNGSTLFTITPTIEGKQVKRCTGVYSNSSGIYVAMDNGQDTGHIHHYDTTGRYLCCVAKGLFSPKGIAFTADGQQLTVADWYSVKMYHGV